MPNVDSNSEGMNHAALWLIGPDMPGLLNIGSKFVTERGGNIDKDIADRFGEKAVVFMSITAAPEDIERMNKDTAELKKATNCGVVFQPMHNPTVPDDYHADLYGFDLITDDAVGLIVEATELVATFGILVVGHTGERRILPGPRRQIQSGQKFVVMLPKKFDHVEFTRQMGVLAKKYNGSMVTPLRTVPGLLWWW